MAWTSDQDPVPDSERGRLIVFSDVTTNDSDKTLGITEELGGDTRLEIRGIRIEMTTTSTPGTRTLAIEVQDVEGDVILHVPLSTNSDVTADGSKEIELAAGQASAIAGTSVTEPLPENLWLHSGQSLRVYDTATVDAAADDMVVHVRGVRG